MKVIHIPKRQTTCELKKEPFLPGQEYFSILLKEGDLLMRKDFCLTCWNEVKEQYKKCKSQWKSKVPVKEEIIHQDDKVLEAFKELNGQESPEAFILSLYLARKKILALRQQMVEKEKTFYLYEVLATEEMIAVKKPDLTTLQTNELEEVLKKHVRTL